MDLSKESHKWLLDSGGESHFLLIEAQKPDIGRKPSLWEDRGGTVCELKRTGRQALDGHQGLWDWGTSLI